MESKFEPSFQSFITFIRACVFCHGEHVEVGPRITCGSWFSLEFRGLNLDHQA